MSEEKDIATIELELPTSAPDLDEVTTATASAVNNTMAAAAATQAVSDIVLDFGPAKEEEAKPETVDAPYMSDVNLSPAEQKIVDEFADKIDIQDSNVVLQYGASAQKKIADFSDSALKGVKTKDLGEVGGMITNLVTELKGFDVEEESGGFLGFFKKKANSLTKLKAKYDSAENNVDKITGALEGHQNTLQKDIVMLDKMYDNNLVYFKELTMYIIAGKKKLAEERATTLVEKQNKAKETGLAEDAQAANDYAALCDRFEKKLHDLEITRTISIQMAPQIRLVQNSDTLMVEKIQSTINNTIPLWKNQMVLALGLAHSQQAMEAQHQVNELTNDLIKKNAEKLKTGSIEIAKESERSIVDIETVRYSNEQLISSLDEVIKIQEEGRIKRREAEAELGQIEATLKQKLLDIRQ